MQLGGAVLESANLGLELRKRVTHNFSTLRSRSLQYKQQLISQVSIIVKSACQSVCAFSPYVHVVHRSYSVRV